MTTGAARRRATGPAAGLILALALAAAGCGVADERRRQERIVDAGDRLAEQAFAAYSLSVTSTRKPVEEEPPRPVLPPDPITFAGQIDFGIRGELGDRDEEDAPNSTVTTAGVPDPIVRWRDTRVFATRHKRGLGAADVRNWASFDFAQTKQREESAVDVRGSIGFLWMNAAFMVGMIDGALTGSIEEVGPEQVGDVATTHYRSNYDVEKALREDSEEHRRAVEHMLATMGHRGPSFPGAVWIDGSGVARRFSMTLEQRIDVDNILLTTYTIELSAVGTSAEVLIPPPEDVKRVQNQVRLLVEFDIPGRG